MNANMNYKKNIYTVLNIDDDEYEFTFPEKITHLELHPVAKLIKYKNITHLEPHPTTDLIKFFSMYKFRLENMCDKKVNILQWIHRPQNYKFDKMIEEIRSRTDNSYLGRSMPKLLGCELAIIKNEMDNAFEKYNNCKIESLKYLRSLTDEHGDKFYFEEMMETKRDYIEYSIDKYKEDYEDWKTKYKQALKKKDGTLEGYLDSIYYSDW